MGECCDIHYRYTYIGTIAYWSLYYQTVTDNSSTIFAYIIIVIVLTFLWKYEAKKGIDLLQTVLLLTIVYPLFLFRSNKMSSNYNLRTIFNYSE